MTLSNLSNLDNLSRTPEDLRFRLRSRASFLISKDRKTTKKDNPAGLVNELLCPLMLHSGHRIKGYIMKPKVKLIAVTPGLCGKAFGIGTGVPARAIRGAVILLIVLISKGLK